MESNPNTDRVTLAELQADADALKKEQEESAKQAELDRLHAKIKTLEDAAVESERKHADEIANKNIAHAATIAHTQGEKLNLVQQDLKLDKAVRAAGGAAYFAKLTPTQKAEAMGIEDSQQIKDSEIALYFGKKSTSAAATQLANSNPARYRQLRTLAKLRGIY